MTRSLTLTPTLTLTLTQTPTPTLTPTPNPNLTPTPAGRAMGGEIDGLLDGLARLLTQVLY